MAETTELNRENDLKKQMCEQLAGAEKVLIGLGEEWKWNRQGTDEEIQERRERLIKAYETYINWYLRKIISL